MTFAVFVLSTGRCGTQWLAEHLGKVGEREFCVEHEPLHDLYRGRKLRGTLRLGGLEEEEAATVEAHLQRIEATLESRSYVECGHPCWSAIPYLTERFAGRVRILHLHRHPIPTAFSWLTHGAYVPPMVPYLPEKVFLSPFDAGVCFPEYQERWQTMTPFEKCLYYWAEVNAFGLEQQGLREAPWLRLSFETLFQGEGLGELHRFLELPEGVESGEDRKEPVDRYRHYTAEVPDLSLLLQHPQVLEVSERLGYAVDAIDTASLYRRYLGFDPTAFR